MKGKKPFCLGALRSNPLPQGFFLAEISHKIGAIQEACHMKKLPAMLVMLCGLVILLPAHGILAQGGQKTMAQLRAELTAKSATDNRAKSVELLNASYDPTREFYNDYNKAFKKYWKEKTSQDVEIKQSHGGSGKQARAVIYGLKADVVTLALAYDIDQIASGTDGGLPADWQSHFPNNSAPYTSTIVFLVRKGNPKNIHDWGDLVKDGVQVITPNPKTSGGARWNYLAAWAYAEKKFGGNQSKVKEFIGKIFKNVPVLDSGARGSTMTFVQRGIGDVLLTWENEAFLAIRQLGSDKFEVVMPSLSIRAEPPVAIMEANAVRKNNKDVAYFYLAYLYSKEGQELAARHFYRPADPEIMTRHSETFPPVEMVTIDKDFGGWKAAQEIHFNDGGTFDQIYKP